MKILHVIPSLSGGGAERMLSKIVSSQQENEHIIVTLTNKETLYNFEGGEIYQFKRKSLKDMLKLGRMVKVYKPNIINTWMNANLYGVLLKLFSKDSKLIFNIRHDIYKEKGIRRILQRIIGKMSFSSNLCIYVSESTYANHMRIGYNEANAIVIPNCFNVTNNNVYKKIHNDKTIIGYVGRKSTVKNQGKLLEIIDAILNIDNSIEIWLVGKNLNELPIKERVREHHKVKTFGELKHLETFYKSIDLLVLTSYKEGFPNVIGEAMSYGVPVATTNAGESFEIIGSSGYKIDEKKNNKRIAEELNILIKNKKIMKYKSELAKKRISENYEMNHILKKIDYIYRKIGEYK